MIEYPGYFSAVIFTIGCNLRCPYCQNPELVKGATPSITVDSVISFLKRRTGKLESVVITGGEPLIHRDIGYFCSLVKELGYKVMIETNGTFPYRLKELLDCSLIDYVAMDYKAPISKYSIVTGTPVDSVNITKSKDLIIHSDISYEFRTTLVKELLSVRDILQIGKELKGAKLYILQMFRNNKTLNPSYRTKTTYTMEELEEIKQCLLKYVDKVVIR